MPYIPLELAGRGVYWCPIHQAFYVGAHLHCRVKHSRGTCCHMGEIKLRTEEVGFPSPNRMQKESEG